MKKNFKLYVIVWAILLAVYNLLVFLVKPLPGYTVVYDARFWIAWGIVIASFIGQLVCANIAFNSKSKEKLFLNIPLITVSFSALVVSVIAGSILMLIPNCPAWISAVVCTAVFAFSAISVIKAKAAADIVSTTDEKIKAQTSFIKSLTVDAESLISHAKSDAAKTACKKVYEAVRYSDPMSNEELTETDSKISALFADFIVAVKNENKERVNNICTQLISLIELRNKKCRMLK